MTYDSKRGNFSDLMFFPPPRPPNLKSGLLDSKSGLSDPKLDLSDPKSGLSDPKLDLLDPKLVLLGDQASNQVPPIPN